MRTSRISTRCSTTVASRRVVLMGHSMGGGIALAYALSRPDRVRGLVLLSPTGVAPVAFATIPRYVPRALAALGGGRLVPRWGVRWILRNLAFADSSCATERHVDEYWAPTQLPGFALAARASAEEFDWRPLSQAQLSRLASPEPGDTRPEGSSDQRRRPGRVTHPWRDRARAGRRSCPARGTARRDTSARRIVLESGTSRWLALSLIRS